MWISLICKLVAISTIKVVVGITREQCCTGVFHRNNNQGHHWKNGLQEAVYHSLTQHSKFDGSLDERVERDRRLWKRVRAAEFDDLSIINGIQSGILIIKDHHLEFHSLHYNCRSRECTKMILAVWDIQRTDHPKGYHITVKLPISQSYIEDSYEYTSLDGLKHLGAQTKHKHYTYEYTIGSDDKHNYMDDRRIQKPIKFPTWNKHKIIYDINKKQSNNENDKTVDDSDEDESDDQVIKIEPRRRFQYRDSLRPKKQGLIVAFVPQKPQKEFQIPYEKYDGFIPISQESLQQKHRTFKRTSQEEEYNERHLKEYQEIVRKYINEKSRRKPPLDFRPSKPYIQYSEPDPLYIDQSYTPQTVPKPNIEQRKFLVIHKYPDSINSQLPDRNIVGAVPTIPYISVTVSNKIPVQNFNQIDLSTTKKPTEPPTISEVSTNNAINNTINDVELITRTNNSSVITTILPPKFSTIPSTETSKEELTTIITTPQPTIILTSANNNLDESGEDSKFIKETLMNRNIIKKDTKRNNENYDRSTTNNETPMADVTETSNKIEITTEITTTDTNEKNRSSLTQNMRETIAKHGDATTEIILSTNTSTVTTTTTVPTTISQTQENLTKKSTVLMMKNSTETRSSNSDTHFNMSLSDSTDQSQFMSTTFEVATPNVTHSEDLSTTPLATTTSIFEGRTETITEETTDAIKTTATIETTTNYLDEARNQLADLFASLTYDLFNSQRFPPPFTSDSSNEETPNYSQLFTKNLTEMTDYTNYDEYLNEETTEASTQNRQYLNYNSSSVDNKIHRNLSKILSSRQHSNSH